jgi:hypothetical protein
MVRAFMRVQIPGLVGKGALVLNLTTLADILLGTVDTWNHAAIRELNPTLASLLPSAPITVALPGQTPLILQVLIKSLRAASALFDQTVADQLLLLSDCVLRAVIVSIQVCIGLPMCGGRGGCGW